MAVIKGKREGVERMRVFKGEGRETIRVWTPVGGVETHINTLNACFQVLSLALLNGSAQNILH